ncbi:MAG: AAA family ATPase [Proteobacteria bacterium]|nr:AAA family ATPase [Pseudomonadota bacterium]
MKLISYKYTGASDDDFSFSEIILKQTNMFVGESGSGKTKLLNTIFNMGQRVTADGRIGSGGWEMTCESEEVIFRWSYRCLPTSIIEFEKIERAKADGGFEVIATRTTSNEITFLGDRLPKLARDTSLIALLKEEDTIAPFFRGFGRVMRRNFFSDELERAAAFGSVPKELVDILKPKDNSSARPIDLPLNIRLYALKEHSPEKYNEICRYFQSIFLTIESCDIANYSTLYQDQPLGISGKVPVFCIKEREVQRLIGLHELSSGMQKVLLLMTDIMTLPLGYIYLLDEYENSLGVNAIHFLPGFLAEHGMNTQFIVTTHHPYLINAIPVSDWFVFRRKGTQVTIRFGDELRSRFSTSRQKAFIQLINDPIYTGVEQ